MFFLSTMGKSVSMRGMGPFLAPGCTFNSKISVFDAHGHATLSLSQWPLGSCFIKSMIH